jgi:galactokinase
MTQELTGTGYHMLEDSAHDEGPMALESLARRAGDRFRTHYGRPPRWLAASPGRVNLIGEHTDYTDGFVLPMAIDRHVVLAADRPAAAEGAAGDPLIRLRSATQDSRATIAADGSEISGAPGWTSYLRGVVARMRARGIDAGPLDVLIDASLPLGGGLSSSAALEVATATLIEAVAGRALDGLEKAKLCQQAEQEAAGVPCGIMDQFSTVMGRPDCLMLLDCRSLRAEWVPLSDPGVTVLVVNSRVKHSLADGAYARRRAQCESAAAALGVPALRDATLDGLERARPGLDPTLYRRARHVISENGRTVLAAAAIRLADWPEVGRLMVASHESLRDDYEVSCPELDWLAERAGALPGVFGSRMTGGGFGGCTVSLVRSDAVGDVARAIRAAYHARWGIDPDVFTTRPARGAALA